MNKILEKKIKQSINNQLTFDGEVAFEILLYDLDLLSRQDLQRWQKGEIPYLAKKCRCSERHLAELLKYFRNYCNQNGLIPGPFVELAYTKSGDQKYGQRYLRR